MTVFSAIPSPAGDTGSASTEAVGRETRQAFEKVAAGEPVVVENPLGNVYVRFGGYDGQVEILATLQKLRADRPELEVDRQHIDGTLRITARHAPTTEAPAPTKPLDPTPGPGDRIDLVLFVPLGSPLDVVTTDGAVEVKGLKGDLDVRSERGDLNIAKVEGRVRAYTARGSILVTLATGVTQEPQRLETETGAIEAWLWEDADFQAELDTSGRISTDFSMEIEHRRFEEPGKHATATVGAGGPRLTLFSKRGDLSLLRLPKHFQPDP